LGFYAETKSNRDLLAFKTENPKGTEILTTGLWRLSRHPNYFGHILQWWALYIIACSSIGGEWSFYGPLIMSLYLLISIEGTEKKLLADFPKYSVYSMHTNKLIPDLFIERNGPLATLRPLMPFKNLTALAGYFSNLESFFIKDLLIGLFCYFYKPNLEESEEVDIKRYKSFNDFFTRKLKSEYRPINPDINTITSPVDGMVVQLGKIEKETLIQAKGIKYNVGDLIKDKTLAKTFRNGFFITIYLAPKNYHRIHSPFSGTIEETRYLEGNLYSVNFQSTRKIQSLYNNNERTFCYVKSDDFYYGLVSVGAAMVGSIVPFWNTETKPKKRNLVNLWNEGPEEDLKAVSKGQELSYFQMGSTVILLLPPGIEADKNFLYESKAVKFGEELINLSKK
jgi:phosphatidylserine decarboxylase